MVSSLITQLPPELCWKDKVAYLAWKISQNGGMKAEELEVRHIFWPGLYIREFELPGDFIFIGRVHRKGHLVELLRGSVTVITEKGNRTFHAVDRISTEPGFQTVAHIITPSLVRSIHENPFELRDVEQLEDEFFEPVQPLLVRGQGIQELLT
jgi:hypothetical protein